MGLSAGPLLYAAFDLRVQAQTKKFYTRKATKDHISTTTTTTTTTNNNNDNNNNTNQNSDNDNSTNNSNDDNEQRIMS